MYISQFKKTIGKIIVAIDLNYILTEDRHDYDNLKVDLLEVKLDYLFYSWLVLNPQVV